MSTLLKDGGVLNDKLMKKLQEITDNCDIFIKYKRAPPKPTVSFSCKML